LIAIFNAVGPRLGEIAGWTFVIQRVRWEARITDRLSYANLKSEIREKAHLTVSPKHPAARRYVELFKNVTSFLELEKRISDLSKEQDDGKAKKDRGDAFEAFAEAYFATKRQNDFKEICPLPAVPRSVRDATDNGLRFFAGCAAKKWPPFGAVEVNHQGNRKRLRPLQKMCLAPRYA